MISLNFLELMLKNLPKVIKKMPFAVGAEFVFLAGGRLVAGRNAGVNCGNHKFLFVMEILSFLLFRKIDV